MASAVTETVKPKGINVIPPEVCQHQAGQGGRRSLSTESEDTCGMELKYDSQWVKAYLCIRQTASRSCHSHARLPSLL